MAGAKLTTIVAIDVVGYSALARSDEEAAVAAVARLLERCQATAEAHGGRIFSTAGDAVLMEFPSIAAGLYAADELATNPDPVIRVGVHLGEVSTLPSGDLLGHGVNVAARLQSQARPGHVLVSEDALRALRGPLARRLVSKGVIKLDKIDENIGVYELSSETHEKGRVDGPQRDVRRLRFIALGAITLAAVVVLAVLAWPLLTAPPATRVAVISPVSTAPDLEGLAAGVADDITLALTAMGVEAIARAETSNGTHEERLDRARDLGAALAVDGVAERIEQNARVTISIIRTSDRTTLWSSAFEGSATQLSGLRQRAAERSADVLSCGVRVVRDRGAEFDTETFSLFLRSCDAVRDQAGLTEARDALAQVVARAPNFPYARALLALSSVMAIDQTPESRRAPVLEQARLDAERAQREDSSIGEGYIALSLLAPSANWEARDRLLQQALEHDELNGTVNNFYSNLMFDLGRVSEALALARRAVSLDPLALSKRRNLAAMLASTGDADAARDILVGMADAYPNDPSQWWAQMRAAFWSGRYEDAMALLDAPGSQARTAAARTCWRQAADAMRGRVSATQGVQRVIGCDRAGNLPSVQALLLVAALGDMNEAFALARTMFVDEQRGGHAVLFEPAAAPMRADPRFLPLMRDLGLLGYWRLSSRWPDFCRDPALPYRCEAEAARLL